MFRLETDNTGINNNNSDSCYQKSTFQIDLPLTYKIIINVL